MPTPIQNATAWTRLQKAFGLLGRHKLLLDEVVVPVVVLEDFARDEPLQTGPVDATYVFVVPGLAANPQSAVLLNDSASHNIIVDSLAFSSANNAQFESKLSVTAATNPIGGGSADKAWNNLDQTPPPPGLQFADSGVFVGDSLFNIEQTTRLYNLYHPKVVIGPGQSFVFTNVTNNQNLRLTLWCRVIPV